MSERLIFKAGLFVATATLGSVLLFLACRMDDDQGPSGYLLKTVPLTEIKVHDGFWDPWLERNRAVTLPHLFRLCEETGVIENFAKAAGLVPGRFSGLHNSDEVLYKTIEAASYLLATSPDPMLDQKVDELIELIAAAQEEDGYLLTHRTIALARGIDPDAKARWSDLGNDLELYLCGHLYEAAVAHFRATGKRSLLEVATRNADLVSQLFGPQARHDVCGHPNVEQALVKLYEATGEVKYLEVARFFVDQRGQSSGRALRGEFSQDHLPIRQQTEAVGQAPRAAYFYSGVADVAALTGDTSYLGALSRIWDNLVFRKLYITGGVGSKHENEGFGPDHDLPNLTAYTEPCAAVALVMWNDRMFRLTGDAKYLDVIEKTLYNNFLAGVSLEGDHFFYACPTESDGSYKFNRGWLPPHAVSPYGEASATRKPWFACACCPPNIARFMPQIPGMAYSVGDGELYVNLFLGSEAEVEVAGSRVRIRQETEYPWEGRVKIRVEPIRPAEFAVKLRIPGWAKGEPVPGDLYRFLDDNDDQPFLAVNGKETPISSERGYVTVRRTWYPGDALLLHLPMPIRRVVSHESVEANRRKVALQRGPIVFCAEGGDNNDTLRDVWLPDQQELRFQFRGELLGGVGVVCPVPSAMQIPRGRVLLLAIPYYAWSNRGEGEMAVWLPRSPK
jgi:uncharacterized protein